jgi:putative flippase GtrA
MQKKDFFLVTIIGFAVGWLILMPAANLGVKLTALNIAASVIGFSVLAPIALYVLKILGRFWSVFEQFGKFAAVGTLNTLIDLGIMNLFIFVTGVAAGAPYVLFKTVSFVAASTNSYFWNKFWTFQSRLPVTAVEYVRFLFFTLIGTLINVGIAALVVNVIGAPNGFNPKLWANIGALVAVAVSLFWNFISYRNIVFKQVSQSEPKAQ